MSEQATTLVLVALDTSFDNPAPVRVIANAMTGYINKLGTVWVEGQIAQLTRRTSTSTVFLTLRDPLAEVSVQVTCPRAAFDALAHPVAEGARVVVFAKFQYYVPRGSLSLVATQIRPIGVGELLARLEQRRRLLAAEGLFDPIRKRSLPLLPHLIGLIVGRDSAAERDVVDNARRRWPAVSFRIEHTLVQGHDAARQVMEALSVLDRDDRVDVIVIARGGGALEDLLPFSDEGLIRAVASCTTPVVSAVGHEEDQPLLDLVADLRASTPTDAAKRLVPDVSEEVVKVVDMRDRARSVVRQRLERESSGLVSIRARPALAAPQRLFDTQAARVDELAERSRRSLDHRLARAGDDIGHHLARVRGLSPRATLERGYSVITTSTGQLVTDAQALAPGDQVEARLASGRITATVDTSSREQHRSDDG